MIVNTNGDKYEYGDITYVIGERVFVNESSVYYGLNGTIKEIRDGDDKETENETPDIYCSFDSPVPCVVKDLEILFSKLYGQPKTLEDIVLDSVIMAPEMVVPIKYHESKNRNLSVYMVYEDWAANNETGYSVTPFTDYYEAKRVMNQKLSQEIQTGCISEWCDDKEFQTEFGSYFYKCWLDGRYCEKHYSISLCQNTLIVSPQTFGMLGRSYIDESRREDLLEQIKNWDEIAELTDSQFQELLSDFNVSERIHSKLSKNDGYWESYWETVSEVGHEIVSEYLKNNNPTEHIESSKKNNEVILDEENCSLLCPFCRCYVAPSEALTYIDMKVPRFCPNCGKELHY